MRWTKAPGFVMRLTAVAFGVASVFFGWAPAIVALALLARDAWAAALAFRERSRRDSEVELLEDRLLELESWRKRMELRQVTGARA